MQVRRETIAFELVRATAADIPTLIDIERSVGRTHTFSPILDEESWTKELTQYTVELIRVGETAVGSISYGEKSPGHVYIAGLAVRPEYRRKGIATNALRQIIECFPDARRIDLVTHPENEARRIYESLGFRAEGIKENFFGDGQPRLVLARVASDSSNATSDGTPL